MSNTNTGGPAFPTGLITDEQGVVFGGSNGMTLRDYFAAKAMQSILRGYDMVTSFEDDEVSDAEGMPALIAKDAYIMADAMLEAREQ